MRKIEGNLNNWRDFSGRRQTLKLHIQGRSPHKIFSCCGAGHHSRSPRQPQGHRGMVTGFYISDFWYWLFSADFPTDTKPRRTRTLTAETGEIHQKMAAHLQNPVNFTWNQENSWHYTLKSCKIERERGEIEWNSVVFIWRGYVFAVHCLIFGVKQKFLRNFAKTLDNIYMIDCTKCCVICTTSYIFYL